MTDSDPTDRPETPTSPAEPRPVEPRPVEPKPAAGATERPSTAGLRVAVIAALVLALAGLGLAWLALKPDLRAGLPGPLGLPAPDSRLAGRLAALEARIDGLGTAVADLARHAAASAPAAEAPPPAAAAALAGPSGAEIGDLTARSQALEQRIGTLEAAVQAARTEAQGHDEDLAGRIGRAEARLDQVAADQQKAEQVTRRVATALAIGNLEGALLTGRPYAAQLASLRRLGQAEADIPLLTTHAERGVPTESDLAARFPALADQAVRAERQAAAGNWFSRAWARIRTLVVARPVGDVAGPGTPAVLARAQVRLDAGDLAGAIAEVGGLTGAAAETLAGWLADARARIGVEAELARLRDHLVDDLAGRG